MYNNVHGIDYILIFNEFVELITKLFWKLNVFFDIFLNHVTQ